MTSVEIVVLVVAVVAAIAVVLALGSGLFSGGSVGSRSVRGRLRDKSERDRIERDHDPTFFAPQGGHHPDPPGMRKPPNEGGLL
jgi:hypothetical protein